MEDEYLIKTLLKVIPYNETRSISKPCIILWGEEGVYEIILMINPLIWLHYHLFISKDNSGWSRVKIRSR